MHPHLKPETWNKVSVERNSHIKWLRNGMSKSPILILPSAFVTFQVRLLPPLLFPIASVLPALTSPALPLPILSFLGAVLTSRSFTALYLPIFFFLVCGCQALRVVGWLLSRASAASLVLSVRGFGIRVLLQTFLCIFHPCFPTQTARSKTWDSITLGAEISSMLKDWI